MSRYLLFTGIAFWLCCWSSLLADSFGSGENSFDIEFVTVGNPGNLPDKYSFDKYGQVSSFSAMAVVWIAVTWLVLKLVHELAHSLVCKRYGGRVNSCGVMILLLIPLPFVDVTSSWRFDNNSVDANDWEMWIYNDGRVRGRVDGNSFVEFNLDNLSGVDEPIRLPSHGSKTLMTHPMFP